MGLAVLAKGPSGVILPIGVLGMFLLCLRQLQRTDIAAVPRERHWLVRWTVPVVRALSPSQLWTAAWSLRPITMAVIVCAIALPWYITVGIKTDGQWLIGFLGTHNVGRFVAPMEGHGGPIFYYLVAVMLGMLPWSVFLPQAIGSIVSRVRSRGDRQANDLFLLCWVGVYIGFFSLARTKLPSYVLPCYPALALMLGRLIDGWLAQTEIISRKTLRFALGAGCVVGIGAIIGLPITASFFLPGEWELAFIGLIPLIGFGAALYFAEKERRQPAAIAIACTAVVLATTLFAGVSCIVDRHQNTWQLIALTGRTGDSSAGVDDLQVATFDYFRPSLVFYARKHVQDLQTVEQVGEFLRSSPRAYLVTRSDQWEKIEAALPDDVQVLSRQKMFLRRRNDVLVIGRESQVAQDAKSGKPPSVLR